MAVILSCADGEGSHDRPCAFQFRYYWPIERFLAFVADDTKEERFADKFDQSEGGTCAILRPVENEELRAAEAHIARLEEELLRLKDVKRELQSLRQEHAQLRRSAEGRFAKFLSIPFRFIRSRKRVFSTEENGYAQWFAKHRVSADELTTLRQQALKFSYQPLISILTPTFNPNPEFLSAAVESVIAQIYENWELILVDDGSTDSNTRSVLGNLAQRDSRIYTGSQAHGGISSALNAALAMAKGEWIALLDHDDLLEPDALFRVAELLQTDGPADVIYSDEDKIVDGKLAAPILKPDWSPEFFLTHDYIAHFVVMRRDLANAGFCSEFDGAQDYDLLLRVSEKTDRIRHIARVLYHWRRTPQSTAHNIRRKPGALEAGRRAIQEHLTRRGESARVTIDWETHLYRVRREVGLRKISIVIHGAGAADIELIAAKTDFPNLEIVSDTKNASGEYILFLDADLAPMEKHWLSAMAEQLSNSKIGAVGARIVSIQGTIETAGLILSPDGSVHSAFAASARDFRGANRQLQAVRNYCAVSGSCLLTPREVFEDFASRCATGSFDFARNGGVCRAVEFCLTLREQGLRTVSVPYAELRRTSSKHNIKASCPNLQKRWQQLFRRDPCYNPNLSAERADFSL
jgi:O-antigen biosynthesis protein